MARVLIAIRDFLVILALSWIGVAVEQREEHKSKPEDGSKSVASASHLTGNCG